MSKVRVYELAKELNISSKELIRILDEEFNVVVKNHMSVIEDEEAALIKEFINGDNNKDKEAKVEDKKMNIVEEYEDEILTQEEQKEKEN